MAEENQQISALTKKAEFKSLTAKQKAWLRSYLIHRNATLAASEAGYAKPQKAGGDCKKHATIKAIIASFDKSQATFSGIKRDEVLARLKENSFRDLTDLVDENGYGISDLNELPKRCHAYVDGIKFKQLTDQEGEVYGQEIEFKLTPNAKSLDMLMRHVGGYEADNLQQATRVTFDFDMLTAIQIKLHEKAGFRKNPIEAKLANYHKTKGNQKVLDQPNEELTGEYTVSELIEMGEDND